MFIYWKLEKENRYYLVCRADFLNLVRFLNKNGTVDMTCLCYAWFSILNTPKLSVFTSPYSYEVTLFF